MMSVDSDTTENFHRLQVSSLPERQLNGNIQTLTDDQKTVFNVIRKHFESSCSSPLRLFISGGGGTGKSHLIKIAVEWLRCFTASFPGADPVIVCGPTGMCAKNIQGRTIHTSLRLPVQHGCEPSYKKLCDKTLQYFRRYYRQVHTVVV